MNQRKTLPSLAAADIAANAAAAGITLAGNHLATVTDLANRFRDNAEMLRAYLSNQTEKGIDREPG